MKKFLTFMFSVLFLGIVSYTNVSAEITYVYVDIVDIETVRVSDKAYCEITNSWDCDSYMHPHKFIIEYKYTLANGDVYFLCCDTVEEYERTGKIKNNQMKVAVEVQDPYVKILDIEMVSEGTYCPTTNSWNCDSYMHLHELVIEYKYTLANGTILYLCCDEVEEYRNTGVIVGDKIRV